MNRNRKAQGATLAELAAAIAVVAIALVGTIAAIASGSALAKTTAETRAAQLVTTSLMEEVRATDFDDLVANFDGVTRLLDGTGHSGSGAAEIDVVRIDDETTTWAVYEVTVRVRWARVGAPRTIETRAFVSDRARGSGIAAQTTQEAEL